MTRPGLLMLIAMVALWGAVPSLTHGGGLEYELSVAVVEEDFGKIKALADKGANVNFQDSDGVTILMEASREGRVEVVNLLLARGAQINTRSKRGRTALMEASEKGRLEVVKSLVDQGADLNVRTEGGDTALTIASVAGQKQVVDLLKSKGAR